MPNRIVVKGQEELLRKLRAIGGSAAAKRVQRKAIRAGLNPLLAAAHENVPVDKGNLRRALTKKIVVNNFKCQGIVGADADVVDEDGNKPSHYDHLVEYGHANPDGSVTPPNPFMRTTADQTLDEAREKYTEKLGEEYEAEALKAK